MWETAHARAFTVVKAIQAVSSNPSGPSSTKQLLEGQTRRQFARGLGPTNIVHLFRDVGGEARMPAVLAAPHQLSLPRHARDHPGAP